MWLLLTHMHAWKHECTQKRGSEVTERRASYSGVRGKVEYDGESMEGARERERCDGQRGKKMIENDVIGKTRGGPCQHGLIIAMCGSRV